MYHLQASNADTAGKWLESLRMSTRQARRKAQAAWQKKRDLQEVMAVEAMEAEAQRLVERVAEQRKAATTHENETWKGMQKQIEEIVASRVDQGQVQYRVKYKGLNHSFNEWRFLGELAIRDDAKELINAFESERQKKAKQVPDELERIVDKRVIRAAEEEWTEVQVGSPCMEGILEKTGTQYWLSIHMA